MHAKRWILGLAGALCLAGCSSPGEPAPSSKGLPLEFDRLIIVQKQASDGSLAEPELWNGQPLAVGDRIQLRFRARERCHMAVVVRESDGGTRSLFPAGEGGGARPVERGEDVILPESPKGNLWYPLVSPAGEDRYFVIADRDPARARATVDRFLASRSAPDPANGSDVARFLVSVR